MALVKCRECGEQVSKTAKTCPHCGVKKPGRGGIGLGGIVLLAGTLFVVAAIYGSGPDSPAVPTSTPPEAVPARPAVTCEPVPQNLRDLIGETLTVQGGGSIGRAGAVRSGAHANAYFVAAEIQGPGMDDAVGTWATNRLDGTGMILSVDGTAKEFSVLPDGARTAAAFSMADPGAREARGCLR